MQVRDLDEAVQEQLRLAAKREGMTLSAFLRRELTTLADRWEVRMRLPQRTLNDRLRVPPHASGLATDEIVAMVREDRGE